MPKGKNAAALFEVIGRGNSPDGTPSVTRTPSWWWKRPTSSAAPGISNSPAAPPLRIDHDRQMVHFSLSTTNSLVIAFGILVLIGISFLFGEHVGRKQAPMTAITSEDLLKSSPNPQVLQVPAGSSSPTDHAEPPADDQTTQQPTDQTQPPQQAPASADRQSGLNYVIMQSYPPDMRSLATEAQTALLLHGVPCTIEPAPPRLHAGKNWISVIGTTGFPAPSGSEFREYVHHIEQANTELHGKFIKLKPLAYKWR
jgi:hypothetical protein